jgi:hypothetical protein
LSDGGGTVVRATVVDELPGLDDDAGVELGVGIDVDVSEVGATALAATGTVPRFDGEPPDVMRHVITPATARTTTRPITIRFMIPALGGPFCDAAIFTHGEWPRVRLADHVLP